MNRESRKYRLRWWTLAVLSVSLVIIGLDNTVLNVALPTIQTQLSASASQLQWIIDAYVLVFAGLLLTMGALGDRFGRKLTLQAGLIIFGLSSFFAAHAQSSYELIAARAVMGAGGALIMPSTLSIITDIFPRDERGKAIGIWTGMAALGIAMGPLLGGWLVENFRWGSTFPINLSGDVSSWGSALLINVPIVIFALLSGLFLVPESRDPVPPRIDVPGAFLSIATLTFLVFAIIEAPAWGWYHPSVLVSFAAALILGVIFIWWERRAEHPMLQLGFFKNARFSAGAGAIMLAFFAMFGAIFIMTQYLQFVHGYSPFEAGVRISPFAVGMLVGAANSHRAVRRFGTDKVAAGGLVILGVVMASFALWQADTAYWIIGISTVIMAFGVSNTMAPATDAVMGAVPLAKAGVGSAMNDTTRQVGGAMGVAVIGSILNTFFTSKMVLPTEALPPQASDAARDSVGAAIGVAAQIGGQQSELLISAARHAFVDSMGIAFIFASLVAFASAAAVLRFMPPRHLGTQEHAGGD